MVTFDETPNVPCSTAHLAEGRTWDGRPESSSFRNPICHSWLWITCQRCTSEPGGWDGVMHPCGGNGGRGTGNGMLYVAGRGGGKLGVVCFGGANLLPCGRGGAGDCHYLSVSVCWGPPQKGGWGSEGGLGLTFQGNFLSSLDTCTSVELGPSHLTNFHHLLNSAVGTVCMILVSFKAIPSCLPRRCRISFSCMFARIFLIYDAINLLQLRRFLWRLLILLLRLQLLFLLLLSFRL